MVQPLWERKNNNNNNNTAVPVTINTELTYNPVIPLPGIISKKLRTDVQKKNLCINAHSSSQKVETTQMSIN